MTSKKTMYFVSFILSFLISSQVANSGLLTTNCIKTAAYNVTSPGGRLYRQNMESLFSVLYSNASQPSGFYNYTAGGGTGGTAVNGLFLCRGDVTAAECQVCLNSAITEILSSCSNVTQAITWYDECLLRYSNLPIFSIMTTDGGWLIRESRNVTDGALLNRTLSTLFIDVASEAAAGTNFPGKKFAVGDANFTAFGKIFALAQCTPDLTNLQCATCLADAITYFPGWFANRQGGHVLNPSCVLSYSTAPFYNALAPPPAPLLPPPPPRATPLLPPPPPQLSPPPPPPELTLPGTQTNQNGGGTSGTTGSAMFRPIVTVSAAFVVALIIGAA